MWVYVEAPPPDVHLVLSRVYTATTRAGDRAEVVALCAVASTPVADHLYSGGVFDELPDELYLSFLKAIPAVVLWDSVLFLLYVCTDLAAAVGGIDVFAYLVGDPKLTAYDAMATPESDCYLDEWGMNHETSTEFPSMVCLCRAGGGYPLDCAQAFTSVGLHA